MDNTDTTDTTDLLTPDEAARLMRVSPRTVRRMVASGDLPGVRIGRQWRISRGSIVALLARSA